MQREGSQKSKESQSREKMNITKVVAFKLGVEEYAIPIEQVRKIINYVPVTRLPETPLYIEGIINEKRSYLW